MLKLNYYLDQLIVVMFLFYSGYGVYYSISHKEHYMNDFFKKRILHLFLEFDCIVLLYYLVGVMLGNEYPVKKLLLALAGWSSVGNSNWYIFSILMLYGITLLSYRLFGRKKALFMLSHFILTAVYIAIIMRFREDFWYNTVFAYVFGILWGGLKENVERILSKWYCYLPVLAISIPVYHCFRTYSSNIVMFELMSVSFAGIVLLVTMKIRFGNSILSFLGKNLFPLYMLQRLPMIVLKEKTGITSHHTLFMVASAILTIAITYGYLYLKKTLKRFSGI